MYSEALFKIFGQGVYLYGICMAVGIICCFVFLMFTMDYKNFNEEAVDKMLLFGVVATAIGVLMAGVFQGIYDYIDDPSGGFSLSGLTFYGGLIGGVVSFLIFWNLYIYVIAPRSKFAVIQNHMNAGVLDAAPFVPIAIGIAHTFGRLGCTFAGCCYGAETDSWLGMIFTTTSGQAVVPTQLLESIYLAVLVVVMCVLYFKFHYNCNFGIYCIAYGVWRFAIEYVRDDYRGSFIPGVTPSQFWAIIMVILGIGYFFLYKYVLKNLMKHPELKEPVKQKPAKQEGKFNRTAIIVCAVSAVAVIFAIVGVCVNYVSAGTSSSGHSVYNAVSGYTLNSQTLSGVNCYAGMAALAYITLAVTIINAALYAAGRYFGNKELKLASVGVSVLLLVLSIAALLTACNNDAGGAISSSYVLRPAVGAWLLCLGGIISSVAVFVGGVSSLQVKKVQAAEKEEAAA